MAIYPESWMYTAAAEDAIANACDAGYRWTECNECGGRGFWCKEGETIDCPLCGSKIAGPMSEADIEQIMHDAGWTQDASGATSDVSDGMMLITMIENADSWINDAAALDAAGE